MTLADFERRYVDEGDPWGYATREYERAKYERTLRACGPGPFRCALELGASIGVLSAALAPRCEQLETIDGAPTAVAAARARLHGVPGVEVRLATIPDDLRAGPWDLVLASEILYYLAPVALEATLDRIGTSTRPGARVVAVHWRPAGPERPFSAAEVHEALRSQPWARTVEQAPTDDYLLDVLERR